MSKTKKSIPLKNDIHSRNWVTLGVMSLLNIRRGWKSTGVVLTPASALTRGVPSISSESGLWP
eukprot:7239958-Pyramimonas_sp.AAC.1